MIRLETERLYMRPILADEDAEDMYLLNLDPDVIKYTGDPAFKSIEDSHNFYKNYHDYKNHKTGRFSTFLKEGDVFIGWCGLKHIENNQVDLGYRFMKKYWGKGYATESSIASLDYGFKNLGLPEIVAHAFKTNPASYRVMEKLGMKYVRDFEYEGAPAVEYAMLKEEWMGEI